MRSGGTVFTGDDSEGGVGGGGGTVPDPVGTISINPSHLRGIIGVFFSVESLGVCVQMSVGVQMSVVVDMSVGVGTSVRGVIIIIVIRFIHI